MRARILFLIPLLLGCGRTVSVDLSLGFAFGNPVEMLQISDKRIDESSGIAPSPSGMDAFYTHNDSGDSARFFRFDRDGGVSVFQVRGAKHVDWEDMASAKLDGHPYLFFGDIGDNAGKRKTISVYRVPEPTGDEGTVEADQVYTLRYPDRSHNAETLMVHPKTGDLYIVTKASRVPSQVFKLDRPSRSGEYTLRLIGQLDLGGAIRESRTVTGGAISPDGKQVVLRTYMGLYAFQAPSKFDDWTKVVPQPIKAPLAVGGEAVTFDGKDLVTTSEGTPMKVDRIPAK